MEIQPCSCSAGFPAMHRNKQISEMCTDFLDHYAAEFADILASAIV